MVPVVVQLFSSKSVFKLVKVDAQGHHLYARRLTHFDAKSCARRHHTQDKSGRLEGIVISIDEISSCILILREEVDGMNEKLLIRLQSAKSSCNCITNSFSSLRGAQ